MVEVIVPFPTQVNHVILYYVVELHYYQISDCLVCHWKTLRIGDMTHWTLVVRANFGLKKCWHIFLSSFFLLVVVIMPFPTRVNRVHILILCCWMTLLSYIYLSCCHWKTIFSYIQFSHNKLHQYRVKVFQCGPWVIFHLNGQQ